MALRPNAGEYMILFVLHNTDVLHELLSAWRNLGIRCISVLHSTTYGHQHPQKHFPMRFSIAPPLAVEEKDTLSLVALAADFVQVKKCIEASQKILGELDRDDSGYLTAWQLAFPGSRH